MCVYKYPHRSLVLYLPITLQPPNFPFTSSAENMWKMNQYLPLFLIAFLLFFISQSQTTSNTSSQQRCLPDRSSALLQLRQEFVEKRIFSDYYYGVSYPKMKSWKADTDCCSWDGVTCDAESGQVIDLDRSPLASSCRPTLLQHWRGHLYPHVLLSTLPYGHRLAFEVNGY